MTFNSTEFYIFLPLVYILYWIFKERVKTQNALLLVCSYIFYGWWDPRFLILIFISSMTDYIAGLRIAKNADSPAARYWLYLSIFVNIGMLFAFKYYNFFVDALHDAFALAGIQLNITTLHIILPVGISFYTFQTLSYTVDVYRKRVSATNDIIAFFAYVSFFPQLVAGPIERAKSLLPQFQKKRPLDPDMTVDGMRQILWGFFKKIVIADNVGMQVDYIFATYTDQGTPALILGSLLFVIQIYADFSGYSDIAIGLGKLFGFKLMTNFRLPLFAQSIPDFWSRWHISMTTWFRDYVYWPVAKALGRKPHQRFLGVMILLTLIGFWHGANWTFIIFGAINGLLFIPNIFFKRKPTRQDIQSPWRQIEIITCLMIAGTYFINGMTSIFFRSPDLNAAIGYFVNCFVYQQWQLPEVAILQAWFFYALPFLAWEWIQRRSKNHQFEVGDYPAWLRYMLYYTLIILIIAFGNFTQQPFIYYQF